MGHENSDSLNFYQTIKFLIRRERYTRVVRNRQEHHRVYRRAFYATIRTTTRDDLEIEVIRLTGEQNFNRKTTEGDPSSMYQKIDENEKKV